MKNFSAEFVKTCVSPDQYPHDRIPEIAIVGRSNVGKSSAINTLLNRKGLAKVGKIPGKTQTINFFKVSTGDALLPEFRLVDLPGYGYAKVPKTVREAWGPMIEQYLTTRENLCGGLVLIDARRSQAPDSVLVGWLGSLSLKTIIVATKADKIPPRLYRSHLENIRDELLLAPETPLLLFSARTRQGRPDVFQAVQNLVRATVSHQ